MKCSVSFDLSSETALFSLAVSYKDKIAKQLLQICFIINIVTMLEVPHRGTSIKYP